MGLLGGTANAGAAALDEAGNIVDDVFRSGMDEAVGLTDDVGRGTVLDPGDGAGVIDDAGRGTALDPGDGAAAIEEGANGVRKLPELGIKKFDELNLGEATGNELFEYGKAFESKFRRGTVSAMTRDQAAHYVRLLRQKWVAVRIDNPHSYPNPWTMKHLNVGDKGQVHIPILDY